MRHLWPAVAAKAAVYSDTGSSSGPGILEDVLVPITFKITESTSMPVAT